MTNSLAREGFSPEFLAWLTTADMGEIEEAYADNFKCAHGIKARWVYGAGYSREEFANMFVSLGHDIAEEEKREAAAKANFMARIESMGLSDWARDNKIAAEIDLWEHNYAREYQPDPEALPYEEMAGKAGFEAVL